MCDFCAARKGNVGSQTASAFLLLFIFWDGLTVYHRVALNLLCIAPDDLRAWSVCLGAGITGLCLCIHCCAYVSWELWFFLGGTEGLAGTGQIWVLHFNLSVALSLTKPYLTKKTTLRSIITTVRPIIPGWSPMWGAQVWTGKFYAASLLSHEDHT